MSSLTKTERRARRRTLRSHPALPRHAPQRLAERLERLGVVDLDPRPLDGRAAGVEGTWAGSVLERKEAGAAAMQAVVRARYGELVCSRDPNDPESAKKATAAL